MTQASTVINFAQLFTQLPGHYVVVAADAPAFTILAASDQYLALTQRQRDKLVGTLMFEAFPDTSPLARKTGKGEVYLSFEACIKHKKPDSTGVIRYDISNRENKLDVRYRQATHYPLMDDKGEVYAIVQSTADITETVLANDQLKLAKLQRDDILSAGMIGLWSWNVKEDIVVADKGLAAIFGINEDEAAKGLSIDTFINAIHPEDSPRVLKTITSTLEKGVHYETEYRTVSVDGTERWVIARGKVERDKAGEAVALPGVMIDISDRKRAECALLESDNQSRFMADTMPHLVWVTNADGTSEYYNQRWYDYTGTTPGEMKAETWKQLFHKDDQEAITKAWHHSVQTGDPYEFECRLFHAPSKEYRWVIGRALPFRNESGAIVKWYGTCTDINEQKRASQLQTFLASASSKLSLSLNTNENEMLATISQMMVPEIADWCTVDLYDEATGWKQVSLAHVDAEKIKLAEDYRRRYPISSDDPTGVPSVVRSGKTEYYRQIDMSDLDTGLNKEGRQLIRDLGIRSVIIAPISVQGATKGAISFISSDSGREYTLTDLDMANELARRISLSMTNAALFEEAQKEIKQRKRLEKDLRTAAQQLEDRVQKRTRQLQETNEGLREEIIRRKDAEATLQVYSTDLSRSNQELEDFAYVASHDLQEPLRKIQAFGDLLESEFAEKLGEGKEYLDRMRNAASRMSVLIEDLLAFSRVSTKDRPLSEVNLYQTAKDVVSDLEARVERTRGTVIIESLPVVWADPTHMRQLLQNLIGNALKFHRKDVPPSVAVFTDEKASTTEQTIIRIEDNGIGFDEKYLDRIFSVFQRLHGREDYEGTGIGLAVCRKIVERYNGTITAESTPGKGSTFIISLPTLTQEKSDD